MENKQLYDYGYGNVWNTLHVDHREGFSTSVTDYHTHHFYEINLILSGNVKILLKDRFLEGCENRIVLTCPNTPHYISCSSDTLYSRLYLVFTEQFCANIFPEWKQLCTVFEKNGTVITLSKSQTNDFKALIHQIEQEETLLGQRLLVYYFLLQISKLIEQDSTNTNSPPSYVFEALTYLENHFSEKINFSVLAKELHIGRTTLMTTFKTYTRSTLGEYLCRCRLKNALQAMSAGETIESAAERCGFSDSSGLIRAFKRHYGTTPHQYVKELR